MTDDSTSITIKNENVSEILSHDIPYKLGKYEIKNELGRGTCGIVYKGYDPFVRRDVAIKVGWSDPSGDTKKKNQSELDFFSEAHAAGMLQHPNIVALYDAEIEKDLNYIVMEYVEGKALSEYCRKGGKRLSTSQAIECIFKCCLALDFAHGLGVIHRDIKPSNIMLSKLGETKLMDFSVAEITQKGVFTPNMIIGSPNYMSPEQVLRNEVGPQSDQYSLASVLYQLLTGETLYVSDNIKHIFRLVVHKEAPKLIDSRPDLPQALSDVIEKALRKMPTDRFGSCKEMAAELIAIYDSLSYTGHDIGHREKQKELKQLDFFKDFNEHQIDEIMAVSNLLSFGQGDIIGKEGDIDSSFYIIVRGSASVSISNRLLLLLNQGDCFGETGAMEFNKRSTTLVANSDAVVLKVHAMSIENLSLQVQVLYYKAFTEHLIYRLGITH